MLMTHAFFKALLFMAAGSVIAAMANNQNIDRMSGFRRALPFTSALLLDRLPGAGGLPGHVRLLLQGRDPRLRRRTAAACTGSSRSAATSAALMTAFYSFRIGFRVVAGEPCEEARGARAGPPRPRRARPTRRTGEAEDTDVGFPGRGAPHRRARVADAGGDGRARLRRAVRRPDPDPGRRPRASTTFLEGTFESSHALRTIEPSTADSWLGLAGRRLDLDRSGSRSPTTATSPARGHRAARASASGACTRFLLNKWYFDELDRRARLQAGDRDRALRELGLRARRRPGDRQRPRSAWSAAPARSSAARSRASCAPTRCCSIGGFAALGIYFLVVAS